MAPRKKESKSLDVVVPEPARVVKIGRPLAFSDPAEMQARVDAYFAEREQLGKPFTIEGLCMALGFASRQSLLNYSERPEFVDIIKNAKAKVQNDWIEKGLTGDYNNAMAIFLLKNNSDYVDRVENTHEFVNVIVKE